MVEENTSETTRTQENHQKKSRVKKGMEKTTTEKETSSRRVAPPPQAPPASSPAAAAPSSSNGEAVTVINGEPLTVINWSEAMKQVGEEIEFLEEILQDLLDEAETAETDIQAGLETKDFDRIMKAAHRIKGSATYLGCEALRVTAYAIQQLGQTGTKTAAPELWDKIIQEYELFLLALTDLRAEIARWKSEPKK